ncbi:hypothetical protein K0M31_001446 [Melipona bicolor]|uniref:Uncharacterized protein n=1 Tax=Melipona bicolor TaxID=60889 RepID=A0AA40GGC6_9HYME|nr:hypothetical protein K0M31_001446 [Melipona bicolor]
MANQEMNLLMPGNQMPWWPRDGWEPWVQPRGNNVELVREFEDNTKLDVTPESNGTSISERAICGRLKTNDTRQIIIFPHNCAIRFTRQITSLLTSHGTSLTNIRMKLT